MSAEMERTKQLPRNDSASGAVTGWLSLPHMLFPNEYVWFLLFSSMDIMLTWVILSVGGQEVNPIADVIISGWGLPGAIAFKFSLTLLVIVLCEVVGRAKPRMARNLAQAAILISATPVLYSLALVAMHVKTL